MDWMGRSSQNNVSTLLDSTELNSAFLNCKLLVTLFGAMNVGNAHTSTRTDKSQKRIISAGEMYWMMCVHWAGDHFGLRLTSIDPILTMIISRQESRAAARKPRDAASVLFR